MRPVIAAALAAAGFVPVPVALPAAAQTQTTVCPGQTGSALIACLRAGYRPSRTYSYGVARDTLFSYVDDGDRRRVTDVYAGRVIAIPVGADPTIAACNGDRDNNPSSCSNSRTINTEHAWPQSFGAGRVPQQSDMHHLYPARGDVNSARSNNPYGRVAYRTASSLYRDSLTVTGASAGADSLTFSAYRSGVFMPRASVRGDLARSVFYFRAIYADTATARPERVAFFEGMKATLLSWSRADPPSADEQARSARVAAHQGNDNPFVLDSTLAYRAFDATVLPVELVAFTATADGRGRVEVRWRTRGETDNAAFELASRRDGAAWTVRSYVPGHSTTADARDYATTLDEAMPGRVAYRLTQTDLDGTARVVGTVEVDLSGQPVAYPSPARTAVRFAGLTAATDVVDALGRIVGRARPGETLDVSGWAPGVYVVLAPQPIRFTVAR